MRWPNRRRTDMGTWKIRFRSEDGVDEMVLNAPDRETAESVFFDHVIENQLFGAILTVEPTDEGSPAPTA